MPDPLTLTVTTEADGSVTLTVADIDAAHRAYIRYRKTVAGAAWSAESLANSRVGPGTLAISSLTNGQQHEFVGYANDGVDDSDWSDPVFGTPRTDQPQPYVQYRVTEIQMFPGLGVKRVYLEKVGKPVDPNLT